MSGMQRNSLDDPCCTGSTDASCRTIVNLPASKQSYAATTSFPKSLSSSKLHCKAANVEKGLGVSPSHSNML